MSGSSALPVSESRRWVLKSSLAALAAAAFTPALSARAAKAAGAPDASLGKMPISLIGLPYLMGMRQPTARYGMARGPVELLNQGVAPLELRRRFADVEVKLIDNVDEPDVLTSGKDFRVLPNGDEWARELAQNTVLAQVVSNARNRGRFPIAALAGCSYTLGMVGGLGDVQEPIGMLWFDAHGDGATPDTSRSGFIEGMPVSMIAGLSWPLYRRQIPGFREIPPERIITVGLNEAFSPNGRKEASLQAVGKTVVLPDIQSGGMSKALRDSVRELRKACSKVYIHVDCDVIDSAILRAQSHTPDRGVTDDQLREAFNLIGAQFEILAISFATWDPNFDNRGYKVIPPLMVEIAEVEAKRRG
jgi:arginase